MHMSHDSHTAACVVYWTCSDPTDGECDPMNQTVQTVRQMTESHQTQSDHGRAVISVALRSSIHHGSVSIQSEIYL